MPRFFASVENISEDRVKIYGDDAFHIARSLRMAVGDEITVSDGNGKEYACRLVRIRDNECECEIFSVCTADSESPMDITLYMGYPKGDKLELVIQKAVELGASAIIPFESSRCIKRPNADKAEKQTARLSRIAEEAAKQCGRAKLPRVGMPVSYAQMLSAAKEASLPLFAYEGCGTRSLAEVLGALEAPPRTVSIVVGCEGGFSPEEAEAAENAGLLLVGLGSRILRCETAPMYLLSALSYEFEI